MENQNINMNTSLLELHPIADELFGYGGSTLLILSLMPQIYKTYSTKCIEDISALYLCIQFITCITLLIYSVLIYKIPLIYGNGGVLLELGLLIFAKYKFKNRSKHIETNLEECRDKFKNYIGTLDNPDYRVKKRTRKQSVKIPHSQSDSALYLKNLVSHTDASHPIANLNPNSLHIKPKTYLFEELLESSI